MLLAIIADDLTGAADCAAPFASRGFSACVKWGVGARGCPDTSDVVAWNSETRDLAAGSAEIAPRTERLLEVAAGYRPRLTYSKIDSTLRGHLTAQLELMRAGFPDRVALVCPAFPANGRIVEGGLLCVDGTPLGSVRAAFRMERDPGAVELVHPPGRSVGEALDLRLRAERAEQPHTLFCDARSDADLDDLAAAILHAPESILPVGSAGLAAALARGLTRLPGISPALLCADSFRTRRVLLVVGSRNPVSRRQAKFVEATMGTEAIRLPISASPYALERLILERFAAGARVVLVRSPEAHDPAFSLDGQLSIRRIASAVPDLGLVLTGGASAMDLIGHDEDFVALEVGGESGPGIVRGRLRTAEPATSGNGAPGSDLCIGDRSPDSRRAAVSSAPELSAGTAEVQRPPRALDSSPNGPSAHGSTVDGMPVILKAGGFGDEAALARCAGHVT